MDLLIAIVAFLVTVSVLITFHEFGHYWVARRIGVRIRRFSVGLGPPFFLRRYGADNTEFTLSWVPLGGYVQMLDEHLDVVPEAERHRAFNRRTLGERTLILLAGPLFNLLFAVLVWWGLFMYGETGLPTEVAEVLENTPAAQAGLQPGDRVISMQGEVTPTWKRFRHVLLRELIGGRQVTMEVLRGSWDEPHTLQMDLSPVNIDDMEKEGLWNLLGIYPRLPNPAAVIGQLVVDGAAQRAGLQVGDQLLTEQGEPMDWKTWVDEVRAHPGQLLSVRVQRGDDTLRFAVAPDAVWDEQTGALIGRAGAFLDPEVQRRADVEMRIRHSHSPVMALWWAMRETWDKSLLVFETVWYLFTGHVSLQHISGPLTIADFAGRTVQQGWYTFCTFLAIISVNLGVLNLLPVPPLDGGRLLYCLAEGLRGKPLSLQAQINGMKVGLVALALLICLALRNDVVRLLSLS